VLDGDYPAGKLGLRSEVRIVTYLSFFRANISSTSFTIACRRALEFLPDTGCASGTAPGLLGSSKVSTNLRNRRASLWTLLFGLLYVVAFSHMSSRSVLMSLAPAYSFLSSLAWIRMV
jgi:hypothetical protein